MIKFRFWNYWGMNQFGDFRFILFEMNHTADVDFWAWKIVICNFVFTWVKKGPDYEHYLLRLMKCGRKVKPMKIDGGFVR